MLNLTCANKDRRMGYQHNANDDETLEQLRSFIGMLNEESEKGSVIVVEGKRDAAALSMVGFTGNPTVFHHFKGVADFLDCHDGRKKMILLLDMDRTGKHLTSRLLSQLQSRRQSVSLSYKRALARITNGKVRHVEDLVIYAPKMSGITGTRKDLYFYT